MRDDMKKFGATALALLLVLQQSMSAVAATPPPTPVDANIFVNLAKKVVPSVVNISTLSTVRGSYGVGGPEDLFRKFFEDFFRRHGQPGPGGPGPGPNDEDEEDGPPRNGPGPGGKLPRAMSLGTGFIIDASGLILTNNHVVAEADEIKIHFTEEADEKPTDGEVVGRDPEIDLALIRVKSKREMVPVVFGDSENLQVGEYVMAVGNPFGQGHTVTHGIISAKGRLAPDFPLARYLQTDAPINPGNSGGPLINLKGEVIGINNAIEARAQGIGFAIPINIVKTVLPQLRTKGTVARGYIGVLVNELTPELAAKLNVPKELRAPFVTHVYPKEPAAVAGLKPYDVVVEFAGKKIQTAADLIAAVTSVTVGETAPIKILRNGDSKTLKIKVAQRPGAQPSVLEEPKEKGPKPKPQVETGMTLQTLTSDLARELGMQEGSKGVVVTDVAYGGPADQAGLMRGDVILEVDRKAVASANDFYSLVKEKKSYLLRVRRADPQGREAFSVIILDLKDLKENKPEAE